MKSYRGFPIFVWVLLGLLAISSAALTLGQRDDRARPAADSFGPSGTSALVALLRANGFTVRIDRREKPRLGTQEVGIAFEAPPDKPRPDATNLSGSFHANLDRELRIGRRAVVFHIPGNFLKASQVVLKHDPEVATVRSQPKKYSIYVNLARPIRSDADSAGSPSSSGSENYPNIGLWDIGNESVLRAYRVGTGTVISVPDGMFATNRFLDRADDAEAALSAVRLLARSGDTLVFLEAAYGNFESPSLVQMIGPWANAAWQQTLFLGVVVIYTLGKRFGLPEEPAAHQRGTRELLDAVADTYTRGRHTKAVMESAFHRTNVELRTLYKLSRESSDKDRDLLLPSPLKAALDELQSAIGSKEKVPPKDALRLIAKVRSEREKLTGKMKVSLTE